MKNNDNDVFDAHLHTIGTFLPKETTLLDYLDQNGVSKAVLTTVNRAANSKVFTGNEKNEKQNLKGSRMGNAFKKFKQMLPEGQLDHGDVITLMEQEPDRFFPFFWFNPNVKEEEKDKSYEILGEHFEKGFRGVKIHSGIHLVKIPRDVEELVRFMQEHDENIPLYIHSVPRVSFFSGIRAKDLAKLAKRHPKLPIIVGHCAYAMEYAVELGLMLKNLENVYFETSCSIPYGLLNLIRSIGSERILFGSDAPVTNPISLEIEKIRSLPVEEDVKRDILFRNAKALFEK